MIGRLTVPDDDPDMAKANWSAYLFPKLPDPPYPGDMSLVNRKEWLAQWRLTDEATRYRRRERGFAHELKLSTDHSFRVDEVQPGRYELDVHIRGVVQGRDQELATLTHEFGVAPPSSSIRGPVDLGTLIVQRHE